MTNEEFEELKVQLALELDPLEILDILGFSTFDLVDRLREDIENNRQEFERVLG